MTIVHQVRCDACDRMLANGPARQPAILTLTQDVHEPASLTHWHFCHQGCLASWMTKAVQRAVAGQEGAKAGAAPATGDTGQDAARTGGAHANAN